MFPCPISNNYYLYHIITVHTEHRLLPLSFARPCFPRDRRPSLTSAKSRILYYILVSTRLLLHAKIQSAALSSLEWTRKNILLRSYAKELFAELSRNYLSILKKLNKDKNLVNVFMGIINAYLIQPDFNAKVVLILPKNT